MKTLIGNILTANGKNYVTAVNGGGLGGPDSGPSAVPLHTDAISAGVWETFNLILQPGSPPIGPGMKFALQTSDGKNYVTAVNGGGIGGPNDATCPIHTDATAPGSWEFFTLKINDTVNPPTVQISPLLALPLVGARYLTAVNGGGIGGPNTQPVHSDATGVGAWEQFSFSGQGQPNPPNRESVNICFPWNMNIAGGNIAGSTTVVMNPDGSWSFSGQSNNSSWGGPFNITAAVGVLDSKGTAYQFGATGVIGSGAFGGFGGNNWNWNLNGTNPKIQANWPAIAAGYSYRYNVQANMDWEAIWNTVQQAFQVAGSVVGTVVTVVGAFS
jgi:hypothetical protein